MIYIVSWEERPMGSAESYEGAQKRILDVFRHWQFPESIKVREFLVHVGHFGGLMVLETDDAAAVHKMTSAFPAFSFRVSAALEVADSVNAEIEAITWRESVAGA